MNKCHNIVPMPNSISISNGNFVCQGQLRIYYAVTLKDTANCFSDMISRLTNNTLILELRPLETDHPVTPYLLINKPIPSLDVDYRLEVSEKQVTLTGKTIVDTTHGVATLIQLIWQNFQPENSQIKLSFCVIEDQAQFTWRGLHLDVCRHFFPISYIKKLLDLLFLYKINVFHWHLTEDQGWRVEIKKYPQLTRHSAWRTDPDGTRYGGFYTQSEIRDVISYAAERGIMVVPEIEMPGHAQAVLASFPDFACQQGPFDVWNEWGISKEVFCAGNERVFEFLQDVLDEVIDLFPSPFIHIGGDECPKDRWKECPKCQDRLKNLGLRNEFELQSYFIKRIERHINAKGRQMIGWDEILEGGLASGAAVMSWQGTSGGIKAAKAGHSVIICPTSHCYFDYRQSDRPNEPAPNYDAPIIDTKQVYSLNPIPEVLTGEEKKWVLGSQGNLWTEMMPDAYSLEYMMLPRLCALAEVLWSHKNHQHWDDFRVRIQSHQKLFKQLGFNYRNDPDIWSST
jgi:hexosaminidase